MKTCDYCARPPAYAGTLSGIESGLACADHLCTLFSELTHWANSQCCPAPAFVVITGTAARRPVRHPANTGHYANATEWRHPSNPEPGDGITFDGEPSCY